MIVQMWTVIKAFCMCVSPPKHCSCYEIEIEHKLPEHLTRLMKKRKQAAYT